MKKQAFQKMFLDGLFICAGTIIHAIGIDMLIQPNKLTPGGLTGLAVQLNYLIDLPTGVLVLLMNIPLFILGYIKLGGKFVISSAAATVVSSIALDLLKLVLPIYEGDRLLVALFGGAITGFGISLLYLRDSSLGGSDIVCTIINKRFSHLPVGKISLFLNAIVIISAMFVYGNIDSALYSAIAAFVSSQVVDAMLLGADSGKTLMTITHSPYPIADEIHRLTGRGATVLTVSGTYTHEEKYLLLCVAKRFEFTKIKRIVKRIDPNAFVIVGDASEIIGNGFKAS